MRRGVHRPTRAWLAEHGISGWPWERGARAEERITEMIWDLLDPGADLALALIVRDALLAGADPRAAARIVGDTPLWGCVPGTCPAPDLRLVDAGNLIRVIVEHKCGAAANSRSYPRFNTLPRFGDPLALSLPGRPHQPPQAGPWGQGQLWQIDYYRCTPAWVRPLKTGEPVTLPDATDALWVLLDLGGRHAADVFWDAHTGRDWVTTGYADFVPPLVSAYDHALRSGIFGQAHRLEVLLRMIGS